MYRSLFILLLLIPLCSAGQLVVSSFATDHTIDFDATVSGVNNGAYAGSGFQTTPSAGQLDADAWALDAPDITPKPYGIDVTSGELARGVGTSPMTGGLYAFSGGSINGRAFGIQQSGGTYSPDGSIELKCINSTTEYITSVTLSYTLHVRNDESRGTSVRTFYRYYHEIEGQINEDEPPYTVPFGSMNYISPEVATPGGFFAVPLSATLSGIYVRPGDEFFIRWEIEDAIGLGARDELAIDDIVISVDGVSELIFYTQNSGEQKGTADDTATSLRWSSVPSGGVTFPMYPFLPEADYFVQTGHVADWRTSGSKMSFQDLTIDTGASLISNNSATVSSQKYINLYGDLVVDGTVGTASGANSSIGFNWEPGSHEIHGSGQLYCSRMRKSEVNLNNGSCDLLFSMDASLLWNGSNCLYNGRTALASGTNTFNVTIPPGVTVNCSGDVGIDQVDGTSNSGRSGGTYTIGGELNVARTLFLTTNNPSIPCHINVAPGGVLRCGQVRADASGAAGHNFTLGDGAVMELTGADVGAFTWQGLSYTNNTFDLQSGSTVEYSRSGAQDIYRTLDHHHLVLSGSGMKNCVDVGQLTVLGDLLISETAILNPDFFDIEVHGDWTNYDESGFIEGTSEVRFYNNGTAGVTEIRCPGGEVFHDIGIMSGRVDMQTDVRVDNVMRLDARLDLNAHELYFDLPTGLSILTPVGDEIFVSEDPGLEGRVTYNVGTFASGLITFPFGTMTGQPLYSVFNPSSGNSGEVTMATYHTAADNMPMPISPIPVTNINSAGGLSPDNAAATADRYHLVLRSGSSVADIILGFTDADLPASPYNSTMMMVGQHYDPATDQWQPPVSGQFVLANSPAIGSHYVLVPNVADFGVFGIAHSSSPLPVELLSFGGRAETSGNLLEWVTASEVDNQGFDLERSTDGLTFSVIATLSGQGNSSVETHYRYLDTSAPAGVSYYRLTQRDFDGATESFEVVSISRLEGVGQVELRLANDLLYYRLPEQDSNSAIRLMDSSGRNIYKGTPSADKSSISLAGLSRGVYLLLIEQGEKRYTGRFVY